MRHRRFPSAVLLLALGACGGKNTDHPAPPISAGPTASVGPIASLTCSGVQLAAGATIQTAVDANAAGTVFCLAAGTYNRQSVVPKAGDKFVGAVGALLDGQHATAHAFSGSAANVVVQNLTIENYTAPAQDAPIQAEFTSGWTVTNNEVRYNDGAGVMIGDNMTLQFNNIHHNLQSGFGCCGPQGVGVFMDSNEIAFNNYTDAYDPGWEAGGGKLWASTGSVVTHNWSHDNHGPGLWDDNDNIDITYAYNVLENNWRGGIEHEISYNASIHDNVLRHNANSKYCNGWLWCSEITVANSGGVNGGQIEIFNNSVASLGSQFGDAIGLIEQNRGTGAHGKYLVQNVYVHDNTIDLTMGGELGAVEDTNVTAIFTSRNNRFQSNTYTLGTNTSPFDWLDDNGDKAFWQGHGQDLDGVFQ